MGERVQARELGDFSQIPERGVVRGSGQVRSVTYVPRSVSPSFAVVLEADGGDSRAIQPTVRLLWTGRRRISGVSAGGRLRFEGMLSRRDGIPTIFNPRYEILAKED